MNRYKALIIFLITCLSFNFTSAQNTFKLSGIVVDPYNNDPIEGAVVTISSLENSITTDAAGQFEVEVGSLAGEISVWSPGYYTSTHPILNRNHVKIILIPIEILNYSDRIILPFKETAPIDEKYSNLTSIPKKSFGINKTDLDQTLVNVPGLQLIGKSGMKGEGNYFNIRNSNSFIANSTPLIVINGVPYMPDMNESATIGGWSRNILGALHARDIENITVLKGSEATSYGSLGANGVVLIETDKAVDLDTKVELISQFGSSFNQAKFPVMNVGDYKSSISNIALTKSSDMADVLNHFPYLVDDPNYYYKYKYNNNTDWQNEIYNSGFYTDNVLKIKGGDAIAKYDISLGYMNNPGHLIGNEYSKFYTRLNADVNLSQKMSFYSSVSMSYINNKMHEQGMLEETNPLLASLKKAPLLSPYEKDADNNLLPDLAIIRDEFGDLIENNMVSNPLSIVRNVKMKEHLYDVFMNFGLNYKLSQDITLNGVIGLYYFKNFQTAFIPGLSNKTIMPLNDRVAQNTIRAGQGETFNTYLNLNGVYSKVLNDVHALKVTLGTQGAMNKSEYDGGRGMNSSSDFYKTLNYVSNVGGRSFYGYNDVWNWININFNSQYVYNNTFAAGVRLAADASSPTGPDASLFQLYPAVNFAWMAKNSILKDNDFINKLNLRAEYTSSGNSRFASSLSKYYYNSLAYRQLSGLTRAGIPNTNISPELSQTVNLGADISFWNHRIDLTLDVYQTNNSKLIMPIPISPVFGTGYFYDNIGKSKNTGLDAGLQAAIVQTRNLKWYVGGTISFSKNQMTDLGGEKSLIMNMADGSAIISEVGSPIYSFYGFETNSVFASSADAASAYNGKPLKNVAGLEFKAGDIRFVDKNNDGVIDDRDKVNLGTALPDFYGTFFTAFNYKNFDLSVNFAYSKGNKMYNAVRRSMESMKDFTNQLVSVNNRWIEENQITNMPKATYGDPMDNSRFSDRWIEDASYLKLKEVVLSYKFNLLSETTVFVSGENLFTVTKYLGLDPETMYSYNSAMRGFDYAKIAHTRTFKLGFKLQF